MKQLLRRFDTTPSDCALALVMLVIGQVDTWAGNQMLGPSWVNSLGMAVTAASLMWRRTRPVAMAAAMMGCLVLQTLAFGPSDAPSGLVMVVIATYSVASYAEPVWPGLLMVAVGLTIHDGLDPRNVTLGDRFYDPMVLTLAALFGLATKRRALHLVTAELALQAEEQRRSEVAEAAAASERHRIARELHDIISHGLGIVVLQSGAAEQVLDRDPEKVRVALGVIRQTGLSAIDEMSHLLGLFRSETGASRSPEPSLRDLPALLERSRAGGIEISLDELGSARPLPAPIDLSAYRIVQEGLTNALKHAPGSRATVRIEYRDEWLRLRITNPLCAGSGPGGGRGLPGMRERVTFFGGSFRAGPAAGCWVLEATLPLTRAALETR